MASLVALEYGILAVLAVAAPACGADEARGAPAAAEETVPPDGDTPAQAPSPTLCVLLDKGVPCREVDLKVAYRAFCQGGAFGGRIVVGARGTTRDADGDYEIEAGLRLTRHVVRRCGASYDSLVYETSVADLFERNTIALDRHDTGGLPRLLPGLWAKPQPPPQESVLAAEYTMKEGPVTIVLVTGTDGLSLYNAAEIVEHGFLP